MAIDRVGLPYSQDWIFVWIVGLMLALSIGDGQHTLFAIHWASPVHADKILGLGQVPTIRLQDALYTPGHLHFWDYLAFSFWFSHFFATLLVAVGIWLYRYQWFHRFAACIVMLAALGLVTYVVFPAAPPWLAGDHGYLPHTFRITHAVVNNLPVPKAGALFQSGTDWGNDVAAVPSLHAGYTMLICLFLWPRVNRQWRPLLAAYPIGMGLSLIYLGEHYLIDILLGWTYAAATILLVNWGAERWAERTRELPPPQLSRRAHLVSFRGVPRPLLAVDAPSMLFRAFYALPKSIKGPDGKPVNALLGTANLILREVERHDPRAVVLCFGPDAAAYRVELFPAYHADREAAFPDALGPQWEDSADFFGAFGWTIAGSEDLEADDILNSYALKEEKAGGKSLLMTGDRDMFQCASGSTKVLYVSTGKQGGQPMGPKEVKERYGIPPKLVPDLIALRGDPSDGIPGAKGVGEKTAVELLRKHGSLEKVLDRAIRETRPALRTALTGDRDLLLAFKDMATLRTQKVSRPRDKRTDYRGAARAARERGMNRLAERLEEMAR